MTEWRQIALPSALLRNEATFVRTFADIYEHSFWVAESVWQTNVKATLMTFGDVAAAMRMAVDKSSETAQTYLLRAHPELASESSLAGNLTDSSKKEQGGVGLDSCSDEELQKLRELNASYRARFGFPFIVAVTGLTRADIIVAMETRCGATASGERREALSQVHKIAEIRLKAMTEAMQ